jgi:serine/threonine-protein kinase
VSDTLAAVLREPITFSALPAETPASIRALLERCLERDSRQRLRDIGEARIGLERALASPASDTSSTARGGPERSALQGARSARVRTLAPWALFAATALALAAVLIPGRSETPAARAGVTRVTASIGVPGVLAVDTGPAVVLSPDGRTIAMNVRQEGTTRLFIRRMDQIAPAPLAGSEQAVNPFFSPDGQQIGFFASGGLKTLPLAGGGATTLTDAATGRGAAWDANGDILFQSSILMKSPMLRITATGAPTERGTTLAPEEATHRWPQFLPGGSVLYTGNADVSNWDGGALRVEPTPGSPGKLLLRNAYHGRYVQTGHLLYVYSGTLYGVRFDLERLEVTSPAVPVVDRIVSTHISGSAQYSVSSDGTLAYVAGSQASADGRLQWMNTRGETSALKGTPPAWGNPRFSPDGTRIAMQVTSGSHEQIAVYDIATDRLTPITADASNHSFPAWTPDGRGIVYGSDASGGGSENLYWRRADGSGDAVRLTTSALRHTDASMDPGGRFIVYAELDGKGQGTLHVLPVQMTSAGMTAGTPGPLRKDGSFEGLGAISPDGKLVAYMGMPPGAPGSFDIYVKALEGEGGPWRVSTSGGAHPVWSKKPRELLFTTEDQIMTVGYQYDGREFTFETPRPWSGVRYVTAGPTRKYDLHPDGTRVVVASPDATGAAVYDKVTFVFNFFDELERLLPQK